MLPEHNRVCTEDMSVRIASEVEVGLQMYLASECAPLNIVHSSNTLIFTQNEKDYRQNLWQALTVALQKERSIIHN